MESDDNPQISRFIHRLYRVVSDPLISTIQWSSTGDSFILTNKAGFVKSTLKLVSRSNELSSFVRQLNNYGFIKVKRVSDELDEYREPNFLRSKPGLLHLVKRKNVRTQNSELKEFDVWKKQIYVFQQQFKYLDESNFKLQKEIDALRLEINNQNIVIRRIFEMLKGGRGLSLEKLNIEAPQLGHVKSESEEDEEKEKWFVDSDFFET